MNPSGSLLEPSPPLAVEPPPRVFVAVDSQLRVRMANCLQEAGAVVISTDRVMESIDLIVIDEVHLRSSSHAEGGERADRPGVIALGDVDPGAADVVLPVDFTGRELALACHLLTQVVRLKRRLLDDVRRGHAWEQEAHCDALTQLPNLRAWSEELQRRLTTARNLGQPLCVALVDLDHFKQVNDGWGHPAGDQLLIATAGALRQSLRQDDFVARLGGDEFGLLLPGLDAAAAAAVVERVRAGLPARIAQSTPYVTSASIGFAVYDGLSEVAPPSLLQQADRARRLAKMQGRARSENAASP